MSGLFGLPLGSTIPNIMNKLAPAAAAIASSRNARSPIDAQLKHPPDKTAYGMYFKFKESNYKLDGGLVNPGMKATLTKTISGAHIFLPLPTSGIIENQNMTYQAQSIGPIMQMISLGSKVGAKIGAAWAGEDMSGQETGSLVDYATAGGGALNVSARTALNGMGGVGAAVDMMTGNVVNPFQLALFESVSPRGHNFTFQLVPRNAAESATIRKIINTFKIRSLPSFAGANRTFLKMPDEVEMAFYGTDKLFKFAPAYINSVQVNYTPLGNVNAFYGDDGAPAAVELTLTLQEIEPLTRESYVDSGDAAGTVGGSLPAASPNADQLGRA